MRPSVTDYMDIAHQIYKFNDTEFTSVVYITDYIYGKILREKVGWKFIFFFLWHESIQLKYICLVKK